ncbi:MAG: prepilin-type N-terminal cleavage/methylation domain-containing protein [Lentisphaerae bacterium]|nr:prepilin-type N-terminal cleavage/methylation domain-containing protein [Lentisphaerota bacterium]
MCGIRKKTTTERERAGFTLLELLLAVSILSIVAALTYSTFGTVVTAWKRGMALSDNLHHGDYVIEQLAMALRSAYSPDAGGKPSGYGFVLENEGEGAYGTDIISWVKIGSSLVGKEADFAASPHRVKFSVDDDAEGNRGASVRAWRLLGLPDDFDPADIEATILSPMVTGFDCQCAEKISDIDTEIDWDDEWEDTNRIPPFLQITLYLQPLDEGQDPIEIKRIVTVPVVTQEAR